MAERRKPGPKPKINLNPLFVDHLPKTTPIPKRAFAVRQQRGPDRHDDLVILAYDGCDAARQWFNYYGLADQTYRYQLLTVKVPEGHNAQKRAIECQHPQTEETLSFEEQLRLQQQEVERVMANEEELDVIEAS